MIGLITNPYARGVVSDPLLPQRLARIGGDQVEVAETRNLKELADAVKTFARRKVDVIAACGGDGTNLAVLSEMVHAYAGHELPRFAILRGGTVNTVAANLGIKGSPEDILMRLTACHNRQMTEPVEVRPLIRVNNYCGFMFAGAMAARFFEEYYGGPMTAGLGWATALSAKVMASSLFGGRFARQIFKPMPARVTVDGKRLPLDRFSLLLASTVESVGLQVRVTYRALERKGHYHLVASGLPPFELARQFHRALLARSLTGECHFDLLAKEALIEFERPEPFIMDGDLFRASRLSIRMGPSVRMSVP